MAAASRGCHNVDEIHPRMFLFRGPAGLSAGFLLKTCGNERTLTGLEISITRSSVGKSTEEN